MSARAIRTAFAAPFVVTIACGKSDPTPPPTRPAAISAALLLELAPERYGDVCSVTESCPKGVVCDPAKPYLIACDAAMKRANDDRRAYLGVMSDGNCHARPATCTEASCFDAKPTPCPHQELPPLRVAYWVVDRLGDTCDITARGLAGALDAATKSVPCAEGYRLPIVAIYRDELKRCRVLEYVPKPLPPGSTTNPPEPRYVPCPAE